MTTTTAKKASKTAQRMRETLAKIADKGEPSTPPIIQEVKHRAEAAKIGRRRHFPEGVPFERIGVKIPAHLKDEMIVAMRTTHKEYPTMELFVCEALQVFLNIKK